MLFTAWILMTFIEFISAVIMGDSDIISDGFFNIFKTISFLISGLSILFNHMYSNTCLFLSQRIELIAALISMVFVVIVSVYMILQALHLVTDDDIRIPPAAYLQWLYMLKVIIDLSALLCFSDYIIHPSIQVKLQLWKYIKVWKKLNNITFEELKKITNFKKVLTRNSKSITNKYGKEMLSKLNGNKRNNTLNIFKKKKPEIISNKKQNRKLSEQKTEKVTNNSEQENNTPTEKTRRI